MGVPSARSVVSVHKWYSPQNAEWSGVWLNMSLGMVGSVTRMTAQIGAEVIPYTHLFVPLDAADSLL